MNNRRFLFGFSLVFVLLCCISITCVSAATTHIVNDESNYISNSTNSSSNIQNIIDNAADGDTVEFVGMKYNNLSLKVNKKLNIVSNVGTNFIGSKNISAFTILSNVNGVNITGFTFYGYGTSIYVDSSSNVNLNGLSIENNDNGIVLYKSGNVLIINSVINSCNKGIVINNSINTDLIYANIGNCTSNGILISDSNRTTISNSIIKGCGFNSLGNGTYGIYIKDSISSTLFECNITENYNGIGVDSIKNLSIGGSWICYNSHFGLNFISGVCDYILIYDNFIQFQDISINFNTWVSNLTIVKNIIFGYENALFFSSGVKYFSSNVFTSNIINGYSRAGFLISFVVDGRQSDGSVGLQPNLIRTSACGVGLLTMHVKLLRTGISTFTAYIIDDTNGKVATNIPDGIMTFKIGSNVWYVPLVNGTAVLNANISDLIGDVSVDYYGFGAVINWDREFESFIPEFDDFYEFSEFTANPVTTSPNNGNNNGNNGYGNGTGNGNGDGNGDGSGFGDGDGFGDFNYGGNGFTQGMLNQAGSFAKMFSSNSNSRQSSNLEYLSSFENLNHASAGFGSNQPPSSSSSSGGAGDGSQKATEIKVKDPAIDNVLQNHYVWIILFIIVMVSFIFGYIKKKKTIQ